MAVFTKIKVFVFGIGLSLASVSLCLLISEVFFTFQYNKELSKLESARGGREICTMPSEIPELIYSGIPGKCDTNLRGFRDYEYRFNKDQGVFRIVVIGDSVAAGHQVGIKNAFAKVLEVNLNQATEGPENKVEVIILAQQGYSTAQELILLKSEAFKYSPDLIVWSYVLNDPAHPIYHDANGELGQYHFKPQSHTVNFIYKNIFLVREKYRWRSCELSEYHSLLHCAYQDQVQSNIKKIAQISTESGIPIIFLIHPVFEKNSNFNSYSLAPVHKKLAELASNSGLSVLDLLEAYMPYNPDELTQPVPNGYDPWHPNKKGHKIAADALLDYIRQTAQFQKWEGV